MWIKSIAPEEASEDLRAAYTEYEAEMGFLSNVARALSLRPTLMRKWLAFQMELTFGASTLSRRQEELIHIAISGLNRCEYCQVSHSSFFTEHVGAQEAETVLPAVDALIAGKEVPNTSIDPREMAIIDFAQKVTISPDLLSKDDIETLRNKAGLSEDQVLDVVLLAAYRNFMNRLTLALGVELEDQFKGERSSHEGAAKARAGANLSPTEQKTPTQEA